MRNPGNSDRIALWFLLLSTVGSIAHAESGTQTAGASLAGTIYDRSGPVSGALIELIDPQGQNHQTTSSVRGSYAFQQLAAGRYEIEVTGTGFLASRGHCDVPADQPGKIDVELRRLDEASPAFAEGDPAGDVRAWLELGNQLLAQARPSQALQEYQKALPHLRGRERAEVLQAMARCHYLENRLEEAAATLLRAVRLDPVSESGQTLYLGLMANLGLEDRARREIEQALAQGPVEEPSSVRRPAPVRPGPSPPPAEPASSQRVGQFGIYFEARNPLGRVEVIHQRYGLGELAAEASDLDPTVESYFVAVPESYKDSHSTNSDWGLLVWVSPTSHGGVTNSETLQTLATRKLIFIGANNAGNPRPLWDRIGLALDAASEMQRLYDLDPQRIYVAGYSGGGRIATALGLLWPEVFSGTVAWFGTSWWQPVPVPYRPGTAWRPQFNQPDRTTVNRLRKNSRFALVTADRDFNRSQTKQIHQLMLSEGLEASYRQIPNSDHYLGLEASEFARALGQIDRR